MSTWMQVGCIYGNILWCVIVKCVFFILKRAGITIYRHAYLVRLWLSEIAEHSYNIPMTVFRGRSPRCIYIWHWILITIKPLYLLCSCCNLPSNCSVALSLLQIPLHGLLNNLDVLLSICKVNMDKRSFYSGFAINRSSANRICNEFREALETSTGC